MTGGTPVPGFPAPGVETVMLPVIAASDQGFTELTDASGRPVDDAYKAARRDLLIETLASSQARYRGDRGLSVRPPADAVRALPLIDAIAAMRPKPALVTSVRDILQERVKAGRNEETSSSSTGISTW